MVNSKKTLKKLVHIKKKKEMRSWSIVSMKPLRQCLALVGSQQNFSGREGRRRKEERRTDGGSKGKMEEARDRGRKKSI